MLRKFVLTCLAVLFCLVPLIGCDQGGSGCDQGNTGIETEYTFELPDASVSDVVVKYKIELKDEITMEVLASAEGLPGETVVLVVVDAPDRVKVEITSFDVANVTVDVSEGVLVNVDIDAGGICQVVTDVGVDIATGETTVNVNVTCFGVEIVDVNVDTSEEPGDMTDVDIFG